MAQTAYILLSWAVDKNASPRLYPLTGEKMTGKSWPKGKLEIYPRVTFHMDVYPPRLSKPERSTFDIFRC